MPREMITMQNTQITDILTAKEASEYLKIALPTLYRYMKQEKIPSFRIGNRWRFKKSILDRWIAERSGSRL
jgi:excisionase family DNA binding protein